MQKLYDPLDQLFPSYSDFSKKFVELSFSKNDNPSNIKTKYAINKLNCYFSRKEIFPDDGSIEHIVPESEGNFAFNVGNLILLEVSLNGDAGNAIYRDKMLIYKKSTYPWIAKFIDEYSEWNQFMIADRAKKLAEIYYKEIFGKELNV